MIYLISNGFKISLEWIRRIPSVIHKGFNPIKPIKPNQSSNRINTNAKSVIPIKAGEYKKALPIANRKDRGKDKRKKDIPHMNIPISKSINDSVNDSISGSRKAGEVRIKSINSLKAFINSFINSFIDSFIYLLDIPKRVREEYSLFRKLLAPVDIEGIKKSKRVGKKKSISGSIGVEKNSPSSPLIEPPGEMISFTLSCNWNGPLYLYRDSIGQWRIA